MAISFDVNTSSVMIRRLGWDLWLTKLKPLGNDHWSGLVATHTNPDYELDDTVTFTTDEVRDTDTI